ncbi:prostaglandin F2-alpha receptor-like [Mytilus edulis]
MQTFCPIFSGLISVFMALDRAMAFSVPFFYRSKITKKVWSIVCFLGFICIACICILPHLGLGSMWNAVKKGDSVRYKCSAFQFLKESKQRTFLILFSSTGIVLISLITICNFIVVVTVMKLRHRNAEAKKKSGSNMSTKAVELRFAVIVIILACVFITCWAPYNVWVMYTLLGVHMSPTTKGKIHMLAGFNFSIDPFVYLIIRKSNRQVIRRLFQCCRCCRKKKMLDFTTVNSTKQVDDFASEGTLTTNM